MRAGFVPRPEEVFALDLGATERRFRAAEVFFFAGTEEKYHERRSGSNNYASTFTPFQKAM